MHAELTRIREIDATLQKLESICVPMALTYRAHEEEMVSLLNLFHVLRSERRMLARQISYLAQTPAPTSETGRRRARARSCKRASSNSQTSFRTSHRRCTTSCTA